MLSYASSRSTLRPAWSGRMPTCHLRCQSCAISKPRPRIAAANSATFPSELGSKSVSVASNLGGISCSLPRGIHPGTVYSLPMKMPADSRAEQPVDRAHLDKDRTARGQHHMAPMSPVKERAVSIEANP